MRRERRDAERHQASLPVKFRCGVLLGEGTMMEISMSGARIEEVSQRPTVGDLELLLCVDQANSPITLPSEVVRYTESGGFAVRFYKLDVQTVRILRMILSRLEELPEKQE